MKEIPNSWVLVTGEDGFLSILGARSKDPRNQYANGEVIPEADILVGADRTRSRTFAGALTEKQSALLTLACVNDSCIPDSNTLSFYLDAVDDLAKQGRYFQINLANGRLGHELIYPDSESVWIITAKRELNTHAQLASEILHYDSSALSGHSLHVGCLKPNAMRNWFLTMFSEEIPDIYVAGIVTDSRLSALLNSLSQIIYADQEDGTAIGKLSFLLMAAFLLGRKLGQREYEAIQANE